MTHEEPEIFFNRYSKFYKSILRALRRKLSGWLESSMQSNLVVRFALSSLDLAIHNFVFFFFKHFF